ncbi:unnamed protein product [Brassicogethes aeneus]|uniref:Uncharacterized protein n=1 Tax=Brassicogethes aeneus TaxID=1431903 RepID=A0A9P0FJV5_BRAAE|nr:unnamed protein product [Brassicogethes aeneus]
MTWCVASLFFVIFISYSNAQVPPRLSIPGAVLVSNIPQQRPQPNQQFRQARILDSAPPLPPITRLRRPQQIPNAVPLPIREIRPVVEEPEDNQTPVGNFDDEVNKLGLSVLQSALRDAVSEEEVEQEQPAPLPFRPQRPIPILRENIREHPRPIARPAPVQKPIQRPEPIQPAQRGPIFRGDVPQRAQKQQEYREEQPVQQPIRQVVRQPVRQQQPQQQPVQTRRPASRPTYDSEAEADRRKKPVVQILSKFRTDNPDGSISWGFENEDGTFKEETLGIDCITRGKYGYIDPDGVKREYNYETGLKCDQPEQEEEEELAPQRKTVQAPQSRKNLPPQFRPQPGLQLI